jgi:hypothetical protein
LSPGNCRPDECDLSSSGIGQIGGADISDPATLNVVRSAASLAPVVAIVCCVLRRNKFRFGHAVHAIQGGLLDVDVLADHVGGDAGVAKSQCQRIR